MASLNDEGGRPGPCLIAGDQTVLLVNLQNPYQSRWWEHTWLICLDFFDGDRIFWRTNTARSGCCCTVLGRAHCWVMFF